MTAAKSAYPVPVDELLPQARELAEQLGQVPSHNRLMSELRIGAPKANALLERLQPTRSKEPDEPQPTRLHLVAETQPAESTDLGSAEAANREANSADAQGSERPETPATPESASEEQVSEPPEKATRTESGSTPAAEEPEPVSTGPDPDTASPARQRMTVRSWPVLLLALPAFVAIWSGWVGLGGLTGFGIVHPLPGIADDFALNTAITLPIGVETYAAYALRIWLSGQVPARARNFAKCSALGSLVLGALGQVAYHLMTAAGMTQAPWWITTLVACLPVAVLGMGAALTHLLHDTNDRLEVA